MIQAQDKHERQKSQSTRNGSAEANRRLLQTHEFLRGVFDLLIEGNIPDVALPALVQKLPEPERTLLAELADEIQNTAGLPLRIVNREPWHRSIEKAILTSLEQDRQFTLYEVLRAAGFQINPSEPSAAAYTYAERLLRATCF